MRKAVADAATRQDRDVGGRAGVWCLTGRERAPFSVREFRMGRTNGDALVVDDVAYVTELHGYVQCLDAKTGRRLWTHDTKSAIWAGAMLANGRVIFGNDNGDLLVFKHVKQPKEMPLHDPLARNKQEQILFRRAALKQVADECLIAKVEYDAPIRAAPVVANGVLYVMTDRTLFAYRLK